jgi:hypothetical protein
LVLVDILSFIRKSAHLGWTSYAGFVGGVRDPLS